MFKAVRLGCFDYKKLETAQAFFYAVQTEAFSHGKS